MYFNATPGTSNHDMPPAALRGVNMIPAAFMGTGEVRSQLEAPSPHLLLMDVPPDANKRLRIPKALYKTVCLH